MYFVVTCRDRSGARAQMEIEAASHEGVWPILKERGISAIRVDEGRVKKSRRQRPSPLGQLNRPLAFLGVALIAVAIVVAAVVVFDRSDAPYESTATETASALEKPRGVENVPAACEKIATGCPKGWKQGPNEFYKLYSPQRAAQLKRKTELELTQNKRNRSPITVRDYESNGGRFYVKTSWGQPERSLHDFEKCAIMDSVDHIEKMGERYNEYCPRFLLQDFLGLCFGLHKSHDGDNYSFLMGGQGTNSYSYDAGIVPKRYWVYCYRSTLPGNPMASVCVTPGQSLQGECIDAAYMRKDIEDRCGIKFSNVSKGYLYQDGCVRIEIICSSNEMHIKDLIIEGLERYFWSSLTKRYYQIEDKENLVEIKRLVELYDKSYPDNDSYLEFIVLSDLPSRSGDPAAKGKYVTYSKLLSKIYGIRMVE